MSSTIPSPIGPATTAKRGTMSAADKTKLDAYPSTPAAETVSAVTEENGLILTAGTLAMAAAGAAAAGALTTGAQEVSGAKTFLASLTAAVEAVTALVRAVGVSLVLRSSLGAGATDKCVVVGSSEVDGTVNASAKLLVLATGIGGTQVDKVFWSKSGQQSFYGVTDPCMRIGTGNDSSSSIAFYSTAANNTFASFTSRTFIYSRNTRFCIESSTGVLQIGGNQGLGPAATALLFSGAGEIRSELGAGASDVCLKQGSTVADASVNAAAKLKSWGTGVGGTYTEKGFIIKDGTIELTGAGVGVVMKSPDGTRYRLTVANGGTLSIAAA